MPLDHSTVAAALREHLRFADGQRLYGVVDAARCADLAFEAKFQYGKKIRSLFLPEVQTPLWDVAPYLVPIDPASGYLDNWARRWGTSAGVLLVAGADEQAIYEHLRKIFIVEDEEKQGYFFRFYDPRVLRTFLPTCSADQLDEIFGPIAQFIVEEEGTILHFRRERGKLVEERASLSIAGGADSALASADQHAPDHAQSAKTPSH